MQHKPVAWKDVEPGLRSLIERACTERQLEVFKLHLAGKGYGTIALALDLTESTVRDHVKAAERNIRAEYRAQTGQQDRFGS